MKRAAAKFLPLLVSLAMVGVACGGDEEPAGGGGGGDGGGGATAVTMTIENLAFNPATISGAAGEEIAMTVTNNDQVAHTFTLDDGSVDQEVAEGETVEFTFTFPEGGGGFHCEIHPSMTGSLEVA